MRGGCKAAHAFVFGQHGEGGLRRMPQGKEGWLAPALQHLARVARRVKAPQARNKIARGNAPGYEGKHTTLRRPSMGRGSYSSNREKLGMPLGKSAN